MATAANLPSLEQFFDHLSEGVLLFDRRAQVSFANTAALRRLPAVVGTAVQEWQSVLGAPLVEWIAQAVGVAPGALRFPGYAAVRSVWPARRNVDSPPPPAALVDGRSALAAWQVLGPGLFALRLQWSDTPSGAADAPPAAAPRLPPTIAGPVIAELMHVLWESPFPALLQDTRGRIVDVNAAFETFSGYPRDRLIGIDAVQLEPEADRQAGFEGCDRWRGASSRSSERTLTNRRLVAADGRERWYREARSELTDELGRVFAMSVLQDTTAEQVARERADRSAREIDDWFDLSPIGMVLYDEAGLLVRSNPAFEALIGAAPALLGEAPSALRQLLGWTDRGPAAGLQPDAPAVISEGWVPQPNGAPRRLRSIVRGYLTSSGQRRHMAILEDRSVEEERDLAQMQIGALMDTAGVGLATFQETSGWVRRGRSPAGTEPALKAPASADLQSISRDIVVEESRADYDQLQHALRTATRAEVRYAIRHPERGLRWLLTRVEPATLASGQRTTSVVTLDVTEQHQTQLRSEQLLRDRELMFSLSEVGVAFLRDGVLQRANDSLAQLSGYPASQLQGLPLAVLFGDADEHERLAAEETIALRETGRWMGERQLLQRDGQRVWVQVSTRLVGEDLSGGVITSFVNVDARHRAEDAVALQARRTRAILDSVLVGIVTVGPSGIEWMNRSARRMFGADLDDFMGQPISTVATPEADHPFRRTQYLEDLVEGEAETFECRVKARDGREFWVVGNAVVTGHESHGRQLTYALLDIERRRQAEARIAEAQASLQRIIEAAPMAIAVCDARTLRVLQANVVAARSVRLTTGQIIGRSPEEIFSPEVAAQRRLDMEDALRASDVTRREYRLTVHGETWVWDARYLPLAAPGAAPDQLLLVATDVSEQRAAEQARFDAAISQREMLVKEVHHRIKNNLQGVAGLMQQIAKRKPEMADVMAEVVGQVQAIAQVYGLQVGAGGPLHVNSVVEAIASSVQRTFGHEIGFSVHGDDPAQWVLPEAESIPIALTINELLTNAVKHTAMQHRARDPAGDTAVPAVECQLLCGEAGVRIVIRNRARLPEGFNLARVPGGVSGLGLVRALLPRRCAQLAIEQSQDDVVVTVSIGAPGVVSTAAAPTPGTAAV